MLKLKINRALSLIIVGMLIITAFAVIAAGTASAVQSGDYAYTLSSGKATITGYTGTGGAVSIPSTLDTYPVVAIGDSAFIGNNNITTLTLPNTVVTIGDSAFHHCYKLTSATLGPGVLTIGNYSFDGDQNLVSVNIPNGVTSIGTSAFLETAIGVIGIPASVTSISPTAFRESSLYQINVDPANLNFASVSGVLYDKDLTTLLTYPIGKGVVGMSIPSSVMTIGAFAFSGVGLSSLLLPDNVKTIGDNAFAACAYLSQVTMGSGVNSIGNGSFAGCVSLYSITFTGLVAPTYIGTTWILSTATNLTGHASASSNFPAPGNAWNGLTMGTVVSTTTVVPGAPISLLVSGGHGYITLTWAAPTDVGNPAYTEFDVYRSTTSGSYGAKIGSTPANSLTYNDTTPTTGTLYYYVVKAVNTAGSGPASPVGEGQASAPISGTQAPSAPQNLVATNGNNSVTLSWSAPSNSGSPSFTRYDIYRGATASTIGDTPIGNVAAGTSTYTDATAVNNNTYVYEVKAVNSVGSSSASNSAQGSPSVSATSGNNNAGNNDSNTGVLLAVVVIVLLVVVGLFLYMRRRKK